MGILSERFSLVSKSNRLAFLQYTIGLKNRLEPLFHLIRSKTKTNRDSLANVFPRFTSALIGLLSFLCPL